jgi:TolB-like protein
MMAVECLEKRKTWLLVFIAFLLFNPGCSSIKRAETLSVVSPDFFGISEELAGQLVTNQRGSLGRGGKLVLTTLVDLNQLHKTSKFGRTLSEALATRLFQHGYGVEEIRKVSGILIKDNLGEIILSRDAKRLAEEHECDVILAGTYALTPDTVIINVKFLNAQSQEVLSVAGMELQRSTAINYLLSDFDGGIGDAKLSAYEMR